MKKNKKKICVAGHAFEYWEKTSWRTHRVSLSISPAGGISVSRPWYVGAGVVERLVRERATWILDKLELHKKLRNDPLRRHDRAGYLQHREKARRFIKQRLEYFNKYYSFSYRRVAIRNQRSLWGSCSNKRNLNFNYKIIFLPADLANYIIVHELCHLRELNHGPSFWKLVEKTMPDHKKHRRRLLQLSRPNLGVS